MRRLLAILTLCVTALLLPAATALSLAAPQSLLPACCRAHGAHHCAMRSAENGAGQHGLQLRGVACPFAHPSLAVLTVPALPAPTQLHSLHLPITRIEQRAGPSMAASSIVRLSRPRAPPLSCS
ncbi:MAG: hypothetical protein ACR2JE_02610 [Acidobacteriaceae bacterium]